MGLVASLGCQISCIVSAMRDAKASVAMGWESSGFLRESTQRANSTQTFTLAPEFKTESPWIRSQGSLLGIVQTTDRSAMTGEATQLYIASGYKVSKHHEVSLGRRRFDFSRADETWRLGLIEPRFLWDPTRPMGVGLTGAFYKYQTKRARIVAYGSPLTVPERGFPTRVEDGTLKTDNPFSAPIYDSVQFSDQTYPIRYNVNYPPLKELLLNPNGAVSAMWSSGQVDSVDPEARAGSSGGPRGFWVHGLGGVLPVNQVNISADVGFLPQQSTAFAEIYPRVLTRNVGMGEFGYASKRASFWASYMQDSPNLGTAPSNWNTPAWGRASVAAVGGAVGLGTRFTLKASALQIEEKAASQSTEDSSDFNIDLPSRFDYKKALRAGVEYRPNDRHQFDQLYTYDREFSNSILTFNYQYSISRRDSAWALQLGADFFVAQNRDGFIGDFKGNDRVRGSVKYVF